MTTEIDPESVVMSAICKSPDSRKKFLDKIEKDDFNIKTYGKVFEAVLSLSQAGHSIGVDSVQSFFTEQMDRMQVLFLFDTAVPTEITPDIFEAFKKGGIRARQIKLRDHIDREIKRCSDPEALTDSIRAMVATLEGENAIVEAADMNTSADSSVWLLEQWAKGDRPVVSGLPELDEKLFLSQFIGYWVIAGDSGAGKSAFMCNIAKTNARNGVPGTLCSLEMSKELLLIRMAMEDPKIRGLELTDRTIRDAQKMSDLKYAISSFRKLPISIIEGVKNIFRLDKISRKLAIEQDHKWTCFDYLQLGQTKPTDTDVVRVYTTSRILFGLTQPDLPNGYKGQTVIAMSQYSNEATKEAKGAVTNETNGFGRTETKRKRARPTNSDLAWSGQIKQDADGILHIYSTGNVEDSVIDLELYCGKQRFYRAGWSVPAKFIKDEQRFATELSMRRLQNPGAALPQERKATF